MASRNYKTNKGTKYLYCVRYRQGKKYEGYCGPADTARAKKKYLELVLEELQEKRREMEEKEAEIVRMLQKLARKDNGGRRPAGRKNTT